MEVWVVEELRNDTWVQFTVPNSEGELVAFTDELDATEAAKDMTDTYGLPMRAAKYVREEPRL
jgi:hypothetical protein